MKFYKFESQGKFITLLKEIQANLKEQGNQIHQVGLIPDGAVDEQGEPTYISGWHVNTMQEVSAWSAFEIAEVNNPICIFA